MVGHTTRVTVHTAYESEGGGEGEGEPLGRWKVQGTRHTEGDREARVTSTAGCHIELRTADAEGARRQRSARACRP